MEKATHSVATFKDLELGLLQLVVQDFAEHLSLVLEQLDEELRTERPLGPGWESIGKVKRSLQTLFGLEIRFRRRGYRRVRPDGKVEYRWPLDELLGLQPEERLWCNRWPPI